MALTDPVPSQAIDVFKRNMEDVDSVVNNTSGTVTNRTNTTMRPIPVIIDDLEQQINDFTSDINAAKEDLYPIVKFRFLVDTYEITNRNELGDTATGETYRYIGATLPFNVTPATNPVGNPDFVQVIQTDHNNLTNRNAVGAHDASAVIGVTELRDDLIDGKVFPSKPELTIQVGDSIPPEYDYIRTSSGIFGLAPSANGVVEAITDKSATIAGVAVNFYKAGVAVYDASAWKIGGRTDEECITLARQNSNYRSQIIIPQGVWVSDSTTQQIYRGGGEVVTTLGQPNYNFIRTSDGRPDGTTRPMYGIIRQDSAGSGWYYIEDAGHRKNGFDGTIAIDGSDDYSLILDYDYNARYIGNVNVNGDEWYAKAGVTFGNSVSQGLMKLFAHKDASFSVSNSSGAVTANGFFGSTITAVVNADKTVTVTHPPVLSATDLPQLTPFRTGAGSILVPVFISSTATTVTYALFGVYDGTITHSGGSWQVDTTAKNKPTVTATSSELIITHSGVSKGVTMVAARDGWGHAFVISSNETETRVKLRNYDGTPIDPTVSSDNYSFIFVSGELVQQDATYGGAAILRQNVAVKWANLYGSTGNIWIGGDMEV